MSFQVRHKEMGVYQGEFLGLGFWHPMSGMPEQGFCEFPERDHAEAFVEMITTEATQPLKREDLTIEPFDEALSEQLMLDASPDGYEQRTLSPAEVRARINPVEANALYTQEKPGVYEAHWFEKNDAIDAVNMLSRMYSTVLLLSKARFNEPRCTWYARFALHVQATPVDATANPAS